MSAKEYVHIGAKIPRKLDEEADEAVAAGYYLNRSELTRAALRALLDTLKEEAA